MVERHDAQSDALAIKPRDEGVGGEANSVAITKCLMILRTALNKPGYSAAVKSKPLG